MPATEQIVGRVGALIGAPTCEAFTIEIPADLEGWEFRPGHHLEAGIAHGSLAVNGSREANELNHRTEDDNRVRHCYILALHDWCWGYDPQWLVDIGGENRYFSHDHGWYLSPQWKTCDVKELVKVVDQPHEYGDTGEHIDIVHAQTVAERLRAVTRDELTEALRAIPAAWPVEDDELEAVGFFLEHRAPQVADRLLKRFGGT